MILETLTPYQERINQYLIALVANIEPPLLYDATKYVIDNGGKRIRPLIVYTTGIAFGATAETLDPAAAAVELIHTYSLIHDDLPAMDNADLRRGQPTCHKAFDEATAILVGDALQALAFEILSLDQQNPSQQLKMLACISNAAGIRGMVAGQILDLQMNQTRPTKDSLEAMFAKKTGALLTASVQLGAFAAGVTCENVLAKLSLFANALGLAYQIQDDILDIETSTSILGKLQGIDEKNNKITYPSLCGLDVAKTRVTELFDTALDTLNAMDADTSSLQQLVRMLLQRQF